jgi:hypothetical protein
VKAKEVGVRNARLVANEAKLHGIKFFMKTSICRLLCVQVRLVISWRIEPPPPPEPRRCCHLSSHAFTDRPASYRVVQEDKLE